MERKPLWAPLCGQPALRAQPRAPTPLPEALRGPERPVQAGAAPSCYRAPRPGRSLNPAARNPPGLPRTGCHPQAPLSPLSPLRPRRIPTGPGTPPQPGAGPTGPVQALPAARPLAEPPQAPEGFPRARRGPAEAWWSIGAGPGRTFLVRHGGAAAGAAGPRGAVRPRLYCSLPPPPAAPARRAPPVRAPTPPNQRPPPGGRGQSERGTGRGQAARGEGGGSRGMEGMEGEGGEAPLGAAILRRGKGRGGRREPLERILKGQRPRARPGGGGSRRYRERCEGPGPVLSTPRAPPGALRCPQSSLGASFPQFPFRVYRYSVPEGGSPVWCCDQQGERAEVYC